MGLTPRAAALRRKAFYFVTDAVFAALIILGGFLFIYRMSVTADPTERLDFLSKDVLTALDAIPLDTVNSTFISTEIANGNISDPTRSVLEQAAEYWARGEFAKAGNLTAAVLDGALPPEIGIRLFMDEDSIYERAVAPGRTIIVARRMVSGIEPGKPLEGSSSYGYLRSIKDKRSSAYAYVGGFAGQGNITVRLEPLPSDVNTSRIIAITLEGDFQRNFIVSFNNILCDSLTPLAGNFTVDRWDLSACNSSLVPGVNNVTFRFASLNNAYIAGGFLRVDYETDEFQNAHDYTTTVYHFPEISGVINLFDAFYIPGALNAITIDLHYLANHTNSTNLFYLSIGNTTVYADDNSTHETFITLSDAHLAALLDYTLLSRSTVPLRAGFENLTYNTFYTGNADVAIITDVSGSMDWNFTHDSGSGTKRNCDNPSINRLSTQRLSVAKCLDKDFAMGILNVSGNAVGLVAYQTSTSRTLGLTTNLTAINNHIGMGTGAPAGYVSGGSTCICCGINSASDILSAGVARTILIAQRSSWNYTNQSMDGDIPRDSANRSWYHPVYGLEASWRHGDAVLGYDAGIGGTPVDTDIGNSLEGTFRVIDLWERTADRGTPEVDFTSGLNSSANTYGIAGAQDGWDWKSGVFDYAGAFTSFSVTGGRLVLRTPNSGTGDSSGAYGVTVDITAQQYATILANGTAFLTFDYWWDDYDNYFEDADQVWVKARWTSPYSGAHYLGSQLDTDHDGGDVTFEIGASDNPNIDIDNQRHRQDLAPWIEGPGRYYLELGGKIDRSSSNEWGYFRFDNILLVARNNTDHYYFRKRFTIPSMAQAQRAALNVLSDDLVAVYVNGNNVLDTTTQGEARYWDTSGLSIPGTYFRAGSNVIAVELRNDLDSARFDLELVGFNSSKEKAMLVMTDGEANVECARQGWTDDLDGDGTADTASDDAIQAACDAAELYGITIYAVGFGETANEPTLEHIARCGNGLYRKSQNTSELAVFYQDVVLNILDVSRQSQTILITSGTPSRSILYGDSTITVNHTGVVSSSTPNEIELVFQTPPFGACRANVTIPQGLRVSDAKVLSYSGDHWTSLVTVDGDAVFNLSRFAPNYTRLGDPFAVQLPPALLSPGRHEIGVWTADDNTNTTGCSKNNTLVYTGFVNSSTSRSTVVSDAEGCSWTVEFEDGGNLTFSVPAAYGGAKDCSYTNASHDRRLYEADAYDVAVFDLLAPLDLNDDGRIFVNLVSEDLKMIVSIIDRIPYLWGPSLMRVEVWR